MVWPGGQGLGRNMIGKLVTRRSVEEVCEKTSLKRHRVVRYLCQENVHGTVTSGGQDGPLCGRQSASFSTHSWHCPIGAQSGHGRDEDMKVRTSTH